MFMRFLTSILVFAMLTSGVLAQSGSPSSKILLKGHSAERAAAGERVRVVVGFSLPQNDWPEGQSESAGQRRDMIAITHDSVMSDVFGQAIHDASNASSLIIAKDRPTIARKLHNVPGMTLYLTRAEMEKLAADPRVTGIETDELARPYLNDSTVLIGAPTVWASGSDGSDFAVAVLDTGSSHDHAMMTGKVVGSACFSTTDAGQNSVSLCPDTTNQQLGLPAGDNCPVDDPATTGTTEGIDGCLHGTHVASTAMGASLTLSSGITIEGVARGANLVAVQVFSKFTEPADCDPDGSPPDPDSAPCVLSFGSDQRAGLDFVLDNVDAMKIASVNMSLGGGKATAACDNDSIPIGQMKTLIDQLRFKGVATVIASGNESFTDGVGSPGCISTAVTVGATTKQDAVVGFSNSSPLVDLLAPGVSIRAAYPKIGGTNYSAVLSGTSMATPHVAGAFALLKSANPGATVQQIEDALKATGKPILDGRNLLYKPRIRVDLANDLLANGGGAGIGNLAIAPADGFFSIGNPGDSGSFGTKTYTLTNNTGASVTWTIAADKNFIGLDKSGGTLAAGASDTAVVSINAANISDADDGTVTFTVGSDTAIRSVGATVNFLPNNDFANALPLSGLQPSLTGSSTGANKETNEPNHSGGPNAGGASIWYSWVAPFSGSVNVTTAGSNYDTVLGVYTGALVSSLTAVGNNDDEDFNNQVLTSLVTFNAVEGTQYFFGVDGFNGVNGDVQIAVAVSGAADNDNFASAMAISGASGGVSAHNVSATAETGEPAHAGQAASNSIWFDWTAPLDGDFVFNTGGSDFDTVLAVYTGSAVNGLTEITSNDDLGVASTAGLSGPSLASNASQIAFTATNGTVYHIAIDGKAGATGLTGLHWFELGAPAPVFFTSLLPYARSVQIGKQATGFMTAINAGTADATGCKLQLAPGNFKGGFSYQTTDNTNATTGTANTPVDIAKGASQNFVFAVTPSTALSQEELGVQAVCNEGNASDVVVGVNSFIVSSSESVPADMVVVGLTVSGDGFVSIPGSSGASAASLATSAIGADGILRLSADDGGKGLPLLLFVCETDPGTGACLASAVSELTINSVNGETRTFAVFANATGDIPTDPANNRLFIRFKDTLGVVRGATNFAVRTDAP